jgi:AmmeMemoRadiSam system protein B
METRQPAVAGTFYEEDPELLQMDLDNMLNSAVRPELDPDSLKALIVPHAGYIYSGPIAATAYKLLKARRNQINRVILLGPSHRVPLQGIATPQSRMFRTPLGDIPLDLQAIELIKNLPSVVVREDAHTWEHSLEVQLPFLQTVLDEFVLVPLVVGSTDAEAVAAVLNKLWGNDETLVVISTDLSHFLPYEEACSKDSSTTKLIEQFNSSLIGEQACGCHPLNGLLKLAGEKGLNLSTLDLRNSGDTAGSHDRVVGYGSYAIY